MSREIEIMKEERERLVQEGYADCYIEECDLVIKAIQRLESIDNANPSEALECLNNIEADLVGLPKHVTEYDEGFDNYLEDIKDNIDKVEQALLKAQEPKHYLKWEDLEFEEARCQYSNVKLGNVNFQMTCYLYKGCMKKVWIRNEIISFELKDTEEDKQFFNDLHLERVEE